MAKFCKWRANTILHGASALNIYGPSPLYFARDYSNSGPLKDPNFFMIATFYQDYDKEGYNKSTNPEALADIGINTHINLTATTSTLAYSLAQWKASGIYSFVALSDASFGWDVSPALTILENNPEIADAVIGWIPIWDEADGRYVDAGTIPTCYPVYVNNMLTSTRNLDPTRPVLADYNGITTRIGPTGWYHYDQIPDEYTTNSWQGDSDLYCHADVQTYDNYSMVRQAYYSIRPGYEGYYGGQWIYGRMIDSYRASIWRVNPKVPIISWLEDCCPWEYAPWACAGPNFTQMEQMVKICLIHGARGIGWFGHNFGNDTRCQGYYLNGQAANSLVASNQYDIANKIIFLRDIHAWVQGLAPVLNSETLGTIYYGGDNYQLEGKELLPSGYTCTSSTGVPISSMVRQYDGNTYWFSMADGWEGLTSSGITTGYFTHSSAANKTITVRDESRTIQADENGSWSDYFDNYEFHLYVWVTAPSAEITFSTATIIGQSVNILLDTKTMKMIYANNLSSITFPHGTADDSTETLTRKMFLQETNLTNDQSVEILQWAYDNGKFSTTVGDHNGLSSTTAKHGGQELLNLDAGNDDYGIGIQYSAGVFSVKSGFENKPLVNVSWYGAVMLCNWLTEMKDGSTSNLVYTGIDTTWVADETVTDLTKTGYRLPTRIEYWYCARYRGTDSTNTVAGYSNPYFTQGDSASGATADYNNTSATAAVAVYNTSACAVVKSKLANTLGLYDMTGNVWEWLENYTGNGAFDAGSCWSREADQYLEIGVDASSNACNDPAWDVGFRIARTQ